MYCETKYLLYATELFFEIGAIKIAKKLTTHQYTLWISELLYGITP